jgi:hypothetical protein
MIGKKMFINAYDNLTKKVSDKLYYYIDSNINHSMSDIEKAIVIYLCLGDVLHYSTKYNFCNISKYVRDVRSIDLDNTDINCKNWSILYHRLLSKYGILSRVEGRRGHYKVKIVSDGIIYKADATAYASYNGIFTMSDISRIKSNFRIQKFTVSNVVNQDEIYRINEKSRELSDIIDRVYSYQNRKVISDERILKCRNKISNMIEKNTEKYGLLSDENIDYRFNIINRFWKLNTISSPIERIQLFNYFYNTVFFDCEDRLIKCNNIYSFNNGFVNTYKLIAIEVDNGFYYYLDDGQKFLKYRKEELIKEFYKRKVKLSEFTEILGIYTGVEALRVRM